MEQRQLGGLFEVSALTLGGGGIGQVWGQTSQREAIATVHAAYDAGITFFDVAPVYGDGEAERVLGAAFADGYPDDVRVLSKCMLGPVQPGEVTRRIEDSIASSFARLNRDDVDVLLLHGMLVPDDFEPDTPTLVRLSIYLEHIRHALDGLASAGRIGAWGISALGPDAPACTAIAADLHPAVIQCTVNAMYSDRSYAPPDERPRKVIEAATSRGIGVMGVRAVQRGALTDVVDREVPDDARVARDFARAAKFRGLANRLGWTAAYLAYRYALSVSAVDTIVLGVKNRTELTECLTAEDDGPLTHDLIDEIETSFADQAGV